MKLLSGLVATALVGGVRSACNAGDSILDLTCNADLVIEIGINLACFEKYYPGFNTLSLELVPQTFLAVAPTDMCTPCLNAAQCTAADNFYGNKDLTAVVASTSADIFFKATECGAAMTQDNGVTKFSTTIGSNYDITKNIMFQPGFSPIKFTCTYNQIIDGIAINPGTPVIETATDAEKFADPNETGTIPVTQVEYTVTPDSGDILLGQPVVVKVTEVGVISDGFYIDECYALDVSGGYINFIYIVYGGCPATVPNPPMPEIDPTLTNGGKTLTFNMFAFTKVNQSVLTLLFKMECTIKMGAPPATCPGTNPPALTTGPTGTAMAVPAGRKRRAVAKSLECPEIEKIQLSITPTTDGEVQIIDGIATASQKKSNAGALTLTTTAALSSLIFFI